MTGSSAQPCRSASSIACRLRCAPSGKDRQLSSCAQCDEAGDLQVGPADLAGQGDAVLQVPVGLVEVRCPYLGDAEVDQRQRPQFLAKPWLRQVRRHRRGKQPPRLLGHGREVAALAVQAHADNAEHHLRAPAPFRGYQLKRPGGDGQVPFRCFQRSSGQLVPGHPRRKLGIRRDHAGGEAREELVRRGAEARQAQADPLVRKHAGGQRPVLRGLRVADRLDGVSVLRVPPGGGVVQPWQFGRGAPPQLKLQKVGEQLVVAEPGPPRVQRDDEGARLLEPLQDPLPARAAA